MSAERNAGERDRKPDTARGTARWIGQTAAFVLILAVSLFASSGTLRWAWAWAYIGVYVGGQVITALVLVPGNPELLTERGQIRRDTTGPDRPLAGIVALYGPLSMWIVAGLSLPGSLQWACC